MLYLLLTIPLIGSWAEGYDGSMMNALQTSTEWQNFFNHPRGSLLAFYNLSFAIGALLAVFPFPWGAYFADKIGRRWGTVCGNIVTIIGTVLQTSAQNCKQGSQKIIMRYLSWIKVVNGVHFSSYVCYCSSSAWHGRYTAMPHDVGKNFN